jgi:hypothetical protein
MDEALEIEIETTEGLMAVITTDVSPVDLQINQDSIYTAIPDDIEVTDSGHGFVLASPGGTRYRITANDDGTLNVTAL